MHDIRRRIKKLSNVAVCTFIAASVYTVSYAEIPREILASALRSQFVAMNEYDRLIIQDRLRYSAGYYQDDIDGLWGRNTQDAIVNFFQYSAIGYIEDSEDPTVLADRILSFIKSRDFERNYGGEGEGEAWQEQNSRATDFPQSGPNLTANENLTPDVAPALAALNVPTDQNFGTRDLSACISTVAATSSMLQRAAGLQLMLADVWDVWSSVGIDPALISDSLSRRTSFASPARPDSYQVSTSNAQRICGALAPTLQGNSIREQGPLFSRYTELFETSEIEKQRISGQWAIRFGNLDGRELQTQFVSYRWEQRSRSDAPSCSVDFHILPRQLEVWQDFNGFRIGTKSYLGIQYLIASAPNDQGVWEVVEYPFMRNSSDPAAIARFIDANFSYFDNDRMTIAHLTRLLDSNLEALNLSAIIARDTVSRDQSIIANSPECTEALRVSRERYVRLAR